MKIINSFYNIDNRFNKSIVLISDLHYESKSDIIILNKVLDNIKQLKPNYICIPGDIIDNSNIKDEKDFINWLKKLSNISKVIISLGNHEFRIKKSKEIYSLNSLLLNKIKKIKNIYLLDNENIIIDNINFIGLTIPMECYKDKNKINEFCNCLNKIKTYKKYYNILLCHSPINICNKEVLKNKDIDLVLCGHMHGGLVPKFIRKIFKHRGIIGPYKTLFPKYAYGNIKINNTNIIISSGIEFIPYRILKYVSPEVVVIRI